MKIPVSELIVKYMEKLGIEYIFGMPGAHILPVYDSLYHSHVKTVLAKHEQGAAFMACGCARASGKISACITTAGPGATNLVTGIANAYADRQPILVITGETSTHIFGKGGLQESSGEGGSIDQDELFRSITRYRKVIERTDYLANVLNQASKVLLSANSGPVLLSIPFNIQKELVDEDLLERVVTQRPDPFAVEDARSIDALTGLILEARNPVIVAGYGCIRSGAQQQVSELSNSLNIPVTSSMKGKGVISEQSALSLGSLGVTSTGYAYKYIIDNADAIIFLGAGFNERTSYLWDESLLQNKKIAQVDSNPEQIDKVFKSDVAVTGDIKSTLNGVLRTMDAQGVDRQAMRKMMEERRAMMKSMSEEERQAMRKRMMDQHEMMKKMSDEDRQENSVQLPESRVYDWENRNYLTRAFDCIIANDDRTQQNIRYTKDWRTILIDHSRAFRSTREHTKNLVFGKNGLKEGLLQSPRA